MPDLLVFSEATVEARLAANRPKVLELVEEGYRLFATGRATVPQSAFLRFPASANRIIALPAFAAGDKPIAGIKWVASFPGNVARCERRASATMVLNCAETGRPLAFLEATQVSAHRTAASAALAARVIGVQPGPVGVVGCGPIAWECLAYLDVLLGPLGLPLRLHDRDSGRAARLAQGARTCHRWSSVDVLEDRMAVTTRSSLVVFATTATEPYVTEAFLPGATILHVSLRDLAPEAVRRHRNVVDDLEHVCRERTSIELAVNGSPGGAFVAPSLYDVMVGRAVAREAATDVVIFSPFGLGILDLVVAGWILEESGSATRIPSFVRTNESPT